MRLFLLLSIFGVSTVAVAQSRWSEPVTVAESLAPYGSGPELVPLAGDTLWVMWTAWGTPARLMGCRYASGVWGRPETVAVSSQGLYWPSGVVDDSGRMLVAFYEGGYEMVAQTGQDSWGIYTITRTDSGWSRPTLAHGTTAQVYPTNIRFGKSRGGSVGMVWNENSGGVTPIDSVMFSRRTQSGWTRRCCLAAGSYPDVEYHCGSLISGDSTDFIIGLQRSVSTDTTQIQVWSLNDSLLDTAGFLAGGDPLLARRGAGRYLLFRRGDSLMGSLNHGSGWEPERLVAADIGVGTPALCADAMGWAWTCWPDNRHQTILASYSPDPDWSPPETAATFTSLGNPSIASDDSGTVHCVWFDHAPGTQGRLRHARRLSRPGVEEAPSAASREARPLPTLARNVLFLPCCPLSARGSLLSVDGRTALELRGGANDLRSLAPGVYFVTEERPEKTVRVSKVILTR
jgi:hypothetical protein